MHFMQDRSTVREGAPRVGLDPGGSLVLPLWLLLALQPKGKPGRRVAGAAARGAYHAAGGDEEGARERFRF